jgi:D-amino peptidase
MREMNRIFRMSFALMIIVLLVDQLSAQQNKLKIYISVDMEGIAGVVTDHQLGPDGFEYQRFREFMTDEAMSTITAAKEAGATEILVSDSHGNMENLLIEKFPTDVQIIRGRPRALSMMAGIDSTFDAVLFIGYHASTNNPQGVRAHTFSSATLTRIAINGKEMTEGSWNAAIAGHFGVPVVMISGDDAAVAEVRAQIGQQIEGAVVKNNLGFHSAKTLTPQASQQLIADKVKVALGRLQEFRPFKVTSPLTLDITFKHYQPAAVLAFLPGVERLDAHSIRYRPKDIIEASNFMVVVSNYNPALEP